MKRFDENLCTQGGDMLAYLYNEMLPGDRDRFELHLADCGTCIDDFAELSQSRYPVYEWKQVEFEPMTTPRVVIKYGEVSASLFDRFRAAFSFSPRFAFGGFAGLVLAVVVTTYVLFSGSPARDVAQGVEPSASPDRVAVITATLPEPVKESEAAKPVERIPRPEVVRASSTSKRTSRAPRTKAITPAPKKNERFPVYSTAEDDEDDSLRLSDIFAELDTSE